MKKIKLFFLFFLISALGYSQTNVSGSIFSNTKWTVTGSPYIVSGKLVVFEDALLTIEPGVVVKFNSEASIELRGKLRAAGNASDSITFTSNLETPSMNSWNGIKVIGTTDPLGVGEQVLMEYCKGMYAYIFINLDNAYHGPYIFRNCYFGNNFQVNEDGGMPSTIFENCKFVSNRTALNWCQFSSKVSNSKFINNVDGVKGFKIIDTCYFYGNTGVALEPYGKTSGCVIENNNVGVSATFNNENNTFVNNKILNNTVGIEIITFFNGSVNFTGNKICDNTNYNLKYLHVNNANLALNNWCSEDSSYIRSKIYDGYVDNSYGLVKYLPLAINEEPVVAGIDPLTGDNIAVVMVYPNPFENTIEIKTDNFSQSKVVLYSMDSKKVFQQMFTGSTIINTADLTNGIYFYELSGDQGIIKMGKIVKK